FVLYFQIKTTRTLMHNKVGLQTTDRDFAVRDNTRKKIKKKISKGNEPNH
ncbi:hypothetical protein ACJX0J_039584, partial [Zea mays]